MKKVQSQKSFISFIRVFRAIRGCLPRAYLLLALLLGLASPALAQEDQLQLTLKRDFGYGGGSRIQGLFTLRAAGPADLARVVFNIDDQTLGEDAESPFSLQFSTDSHALGVHTLSAVGYTQDGRQLQSNQIRIEFVSADEGWRTVGTILVPLLAIVFGLMFLSFVVPWIFRRGKPLSLPAGAPRRYGFFGGAICPKCGRPFSLNIFGLNLLVGRLERCPYCGRLSLVRRASPWQLKEAEAAELADAVQPEPSLSAEERLRRDLEASRYEDI